MEKEINETKQLIETYKFGTADKVVDEWKQGFTAYMNLEMDLMLGVKKTMTSKWKMITFLQTSTVYWMIYEAEKAGLYKNKNQVPNFDAEKIIKDVIKSAIKLSTKIEG